MMKLSMSLIGKYLEKFRPEYHIVNDTLSISGVRFLSTSLETFSNDYVYIGDAKEYYQDNRYKNALLLTNGQNQLICHDANYEDLFNEVLSSFEFYNRIEQTLIMEAAKGSKLSKLVSIMGTIYEDAILFFDMEGKLIASEHDSFLQEDMIYQELKQHKRMELNSLGRTFFQQDGTISHDLTDYPQQLFQKNETRGTIAMYLKANQERVGFLMLFPRNELNAATGIHLANLFSQCSIMAKEFTDTTSILTPKRTILESLLREEKIPTPDVLQQLEQSINMSKNGCIILFQNQSIQNYTIYRMAERTLNQLQNNISCEYQNSMVILTAVSNRKSILKCLKENLIYGKYTIGISMTIQTAKQIPMAYRQAQFALKNGSNLGIYHCKDFALEYLIQNLKNQEMAMELLHPLIGILKQYDQDNHTKLYQTLRTYLLNNSSQIKTAEALNVHLNTLKYRLKRIEEIDHINFSNFSKEKELFYLRLSIEMLDSI